MSEDEPWDYDDDAIGCSNCDGEGYVHGCSWDWQCPTYDFSANECLCVSRCEFCNPAPLTPAQQAERDALRQVLADALKETASDR